MGNGHIYRADHGIVCIPKDLLNDMSTDMQTKGSLCVIINLLENTQTSAVKEFAEKLNCTEEKFIEYLNLLNQYGQYAHIECDKEGA